MDFQVATLHQVDVVLGDVGFGGAAAAAVVAVMTSVARICSGHLDPCSINFGCNVACCWG